MVMCVKNICVLIYGRFAVSHQHDAALKRELEDNEKRGFSTRQGSARYRFQIRQKMCAVLLSHVLKEIQTLANIEKSYWLIINLES